VLAAQVIQCGKIAMQGAHRNAQLFGQISSFLVGLALEQHNGEALLSNGDSNPKYQMPCYQLFRRRDNMTFINRITGQMTIDSTGHLSNTYKA
jgi:hypothetical protein